VKQFSRDNWPWNNQCRLCQLSTKEICDWVQSSACLIFLYTVSHKKRPNIYWTVILVLFIGFLHLCTHWKVWNRKEYSFDFQIHFYCVVNCGSVTGNLKWLWPTASCTAFDRTGPFAEAFQCWSFPVFVRVVFVSLLAEDLDSCRCLINILPSKRNTFHCIIIIKCNWMSRHCSEALLTRRYQAVN